MISIKSPTPSRRAVLAATCLGVGSSAEFSCACANLQAEQANSPNTNEAARTNVVADERWRELMQWISSVAMIFKRAFTRTDACTELTSQAITDEMLRRLHTK